MMSASTDPSPLCFKHFRSGWNWFFFDSPDPRICAVIRIGYAALLLMMLLVQLPDVVIWYSDAGVMTYEESRLVVDADAATIFSVVDNTPATVQFFYSLLLLQTILLLIGFGGRFQALAILFWLTSFQHRNNLLLDGEDTVFRMLAFLIAMSPCDAFYSVSSWYRRRNSQPRCNQPAWALRLMQIQISLIYFSTAWEKLNGNAWLDGTAMYYVSRLDDLFGRGPVPGFLFDNLIGLKLMTWSALLVEILLPVALWFRQTRRFAVMTGLVLHLAIEWMMNLFFFEWIMMVGLCSFLIPDDFRLVYQRCRACLCLGKPGISDPPRTPARPLSRST